MSGSASRLRFILGLKLKQLRTDRGWTLKEAAGRAGLSFSYLSEIEKGKKYPAPEKLFDLAAAYDAPFDELVSLRLSDELEPLQRVLRSEFLREFPLEMFGVRREDLLSLASDDPEKAASLVGALVDVGQAYDLQVEHFLLAALRSYQQMHANYFRELEAKAAEVRSELNLSPDGVLPLNALRQPLFERYAIDVDTEALRDHPDLMGFRSVFVSDSPPRLLINPRLLPSQQKFVLARELGYRLLDLPEYVPTSSWLRVESFEQLRSNFKASYFAGALLMPESSSVEALSSFFTASRWDPASLEVLRRQFDVTPEMLAYRITQLAPEHLGLRELFFLRFARSAAGSYQLTKVFNLSRAPVPHGLGLGEHYCRRWPAMRLLASSPPGGTLLQRSHFVTEDAEFLVLSQSRPLALRDDADSAVSVGFLVDDQLASRVGFLTDPAIPRTQVGLTCERCPLTPADCADRAAPPRRHQALQRRQRQERALAELGVY